MTLQLPFRYAATWSGADVLRAVWLAGVGMTAVVMLVSNLRFYHALRKRRKPLDAAAARPRA